MARHSSSRRPGGPASPPRAGWWAVLLGGVALLVTALVLALTSGVPDDFGDRTAGAPPDPVVTPAPTTEAAPVEDTPAALTTGTSAGSPSRTQAPVAPVPAEGRRPATAEQLTEQVPPVALRIPAVDVAVDVVPVGVRDDGQMEIPESGFDVGWYRYGAAPGGGLGSAVLASHVDTLAEGKGVLARLTDLRAGDLVTVTLEDGSSVDYEVTSRRTVPKADLDTGSLFDRSGPEVLQLVTCGGPWQADRSSYRDNVIVTAEPVAASS